MSGVPGKVYYLETIACALNVIINIFSLVSSSIYYEAVIIDILYLQYFGKNNVAAKLSDPIELFQLRFRFGIVGIKRVGELIGVRARRK